MHSGVLFVVVLACTTKKKTAEHIKHRKVPRKKKEVKEREKKNQSRKKKHRKEHNKSNTDWRIIMKHTAVKQRLIIIFRV